MSGGELPVVENEAFAKAKAYESPAERTEGFGRRDSDEKMPVIGDLAGCESGAISPHGTATSAGSASTEVADGMEVWDSKVPEDCDYLGDG